MRELTYAGFKPTIANMSDEKWRLATHKVIDLLRARQEKRHRDLIVMFYLGIVLSLIAPAFLGTIFYFIWGSIAANFGWVHLWWVVFFILAAGIMLPLLYLREKNQFDAQPIIVRTDARGEKVLYMDKIEVDLQSFAAFGVNLIGDEAGDDKWFVRPFFIGPRMVARSRPQQQMLGTLSSTANMMAAAEILTHLAKHQHGVAVDDLPLNQTLRNTLIPTLAYLRQLGWIDMKADGTRVWFGADQRRIIDQALLDCGIKPEPI